MKYLNRILIAAASLALVGCGHYATGRYAISTDNALALRSMDDAQVNVGAFTDPKNTVTVSCTGEGPVATVDGEPFAAFIQKAFEDELKMAGIYSEAAPTTITATLDKIDVSTALDSQWELQLTVQSTNGTSIVVNEIYDYGYSWAPGDGECVQAAVAFVPAVQNVIGKVIKELPTLIK